jgi:hypothetical protein
LIVADPQQMHLEGLGQEILGIPAIRTRQGQIFDSVSGHLRPSPARVYPNPHVRSPGFVGTRTEIAAQAPALPRQSGAA